MPTSTTKGAPTDAFLASHSPTLPLRSPTTRRSPSAVPLLDPDGTPNSQPSVIAEGVLEISAYCEGTSLPDEPTAEEKRLHRTFCAGVEAAKEVYTHSSTIGALKRLQAADPQLWHAFRRCLAVTRAIAGGRVAAWWRDWLASCREGVDALATTAITATPDPTDQEVAIAACRELRAAYRAKANTWLSVFDYRRALVLLTIQCDIYAERYENRPSQRRTTTLRGSRLGALRALFREMEACKQGGSSLCWGAFERAEGEGQRWRILTDRLGMGILLLLDIPEGEARFFRRDAPIPVLVAWAKLIPSVVLGVERAAATAERYHSAIGRDSDIAPTLPFLKLEDPNPAYDNASCPSVEQWDECSKRREGELTVDPRYLMVDLDIVAAKRRSGKAGQSGQWDGDVADDDLCAAAELAMQSSGTPW